MRITRTVVLEADEDEVWQALVDDEVRREWLDDDRPIDVVRRVDGHELVWHWADDDGSSSLVTITLESIDEHHTELTVTEQRTAAAACTLDDPTVDVEMWDRRLLGLELRCLLRATAVTPVR